MLGNNKCAASFVTMSMQGLNICFDQLDPALCKRLEERGDGINNVFSWVNTDHCSAVAQGGKAMLVFIDNPPKIAVCQFVLTAVHLCAFIDPLRWIRSVYRPIHHRYRFLRLAPGLLPTCHTSLLFCGGGPTKKWGGYLLCNHPAESGKSSALYRAGRNAFCDLIFEDRIKDQNWHQSDC